MRHFNANAKSGRFGATSLRVMLVAATFILLHNVARADGDSGIQSIASVHVEASWFVSIVGVAPFNNPDGCGNSTMVMILTSAAGYTDMYAAILAAQASGKSVGFWLHGCAATSWGFTIPTVYSVSVIS